MIYKFTPPNEFALENLASNSLYCRRFEDFNDPFEFWGKLYADLPDMDDSNFRFQKALEAWGVPDLKIKDLSTDFLDFETIHEYFQGLVDDSAPFSHLFDSCRITCFSSDPYNLLMWSHYADGLRGFCIEFDDKKLINEDEYRFLTKVKYAKSPPVIDSLVHSIIEDQFYYAIENGYEEYQGEMFRKQLNEMMRDALASKPHEWKYEKEIRLIISNVRDSKEPISYQYPADAVKSIILGERMPNSFKYRLIETIGHFSVPVTTKIAMRSKNQYKLVIMDAKL